MPGGIGRSLGNHEKSGPGGGTGWQPTSGAVFEVVTGPATEAVVGVAGLAVGEVDEGDAFLPEVPVPHPAPIAMVSAAATQIDRRPPSAITASHDGRQGRTTFTAPMSSGLLLQVLVTGLAAGAAYALVGLGFALVYRLTGVLQLAHGDIVGAATFLVLALVAGTGPVTRSNVAFWPLFGTGVVAVALAAAAGAGLYLGLLRPFYRRRSTVGWVGVVVAVAFAIEGVLAAGFPREGYVFPDLLPGSGSRPLSLGGGATIPVRTFWLLAVALLVAGLAWWWLARSGTGRAMAAVADDPEAAEIVGLPVDRLVALGFALATGLAAVAGIVVAPSGPLTPQTGLLLGLKGTAAALVARFGSPMRVLAAGLILGVFEAGVTSLSISPGPAWRDIAPLLVALAVIAVRAPRSPADSVE